MEWLEDKDLTVEEIVINLFKNKESFLVVDYWEYELEKLGGIIQNEAH